MEKKIWTRPLAEVEQFMANEYIAACGDQNTVYKFVCDAPKGTLYYYSNLSASEAAPTTWPTTTNWWGTVTAARELGSYKPCSASHEASTQNPFYWGFVDYDKDGRHDDNETVIVWRGPRNNNGHATAQLDMDAWETAKS